MADEFWKNDAIVTPQAQPAGDEWWKGDTLVHAPASGMAMDVAKSAGTGLIKGAAGLAGLPGDVSNLLAKGSKTASDYIADKIGIDKGPDIASPVLPTSEGVQRTVEKATGPLHQPETTPGKYAETAAEFVPGALAMGPGEGVAGAISNAGKLAAVPGVASEALGQKFEGTWLEPYARLLGAFGGGGLASAGSKLGEIAANRSAAAKGAVELGENVPPSAVRKLAQNYEADQLTPEAVAARQAELGPEAMALDMGRQLQGRAEAIASQPGKGQNTVLNAVESRTGTFGSGTADRTKDTLDQVMGPSPDLVATRNHINDVVDQMAKPLYDKVMSANPVVSVPESITSRPVIAQAMKDAEQLAKNHGEKLSGPAETKTIISGPGYHIAEDIPVPAKTSLGYWDYVKKALDSRINGMMKSGGIQDLDSAGKADLSGLLDAKNALVNHLDNVTGGAYAMARKASATKFQVNDAIDMGRSALNTKLLPEELAEQMNGMSLPEREGLKTGMRREIDRIIDTARNDGAAARRLLDTNQNREKIAHVFGQDAANAVDKRIAAETQFQDATNKISSNSRTAVRQQLMKDTEAHSIAQPPSATILGLGHAALRRGQQYLGDLSLERTKEGIGDLLTRRGENIQTLAKVLSRYNAARVANAAAPMGQQASRLSAVLASQSPSLFSGFLPGNRQPQ